MHWLFFGGNKSSLRFSMLRMLPGFCGPAGFAGLPRWKFFSVKDWKKWLSNKNPTFLPAGKVKRPKL